MALRVALGVGALVWTAALAVCAGWPERTAALFVAELSLVYPLWYLALSFKRGGFARST